MKFTNETIEKLASIAGIEITEESRAAVAKELATIVDWVHHLKKVDTDNIPPQRTMCTEANRFAAPVPQQPLPIQKVLLNVKKHDGAYVHIPPVSHD